MNKLQLLYDILFFFVGFLSSLYSQTPKWVSTEVQNRTAILENFTGIYDSECPKGHKTAIEILKEYPDNFIIINNYYRIANYSTSNKSFNLTIPEGDSIASKAGSYGMFPPGIGSTPCGSINRVLNPFDKKSYDTKTLAMSSKAWETAVYHITEQKSIVNVYVNPEINIKTRELSVEVEYYYTEDSPVSENFLTIMLLQNEIVGYQAGGNKYNPDYVPHDTIVSVRDSLYRHMHVLRKLISGGGAWGDTITNTQKGTYEYKKYTLNLSDSINNIPIDINNLEVVAFISESKSNIYTGHKAFAEISDDFKTDLSVEDLTEYNNTLKFEPIHPKVKVTNNSDLPVTKFDIEYSLVNTKTALYWNYNRYKIDTTQKSDTVFSKIDTYSGTLNKGESTIFEFSEITQKDLKAASTYIIQTSVSNIYRNELELFDIDTTNNTKKTTKICLIDTLFNETEITFEISDTTLNIDLLPAHTVLDKSINPYFSFTQDDYFRNYLEYNGAKNTKTAILFLLGKEYNVMYKPGYIIFGKINCKDTPYKILSYYYAYSDGSENGTSPKIIVEISKDWGQTWEKISERFCEETGKPNGFDIFYIPKSDDYKYVEINLSDYITENFILRIGGVPGTGGQLLYLDEISLKNAPEESIKEEINLSV
ncbi:MAG: Omp28-related outer membrane protein, partial [Bacteroidetes bacterium]|nr:Omp28-related outer membrane protein [Bacteroidota bacterium]